MKIYYHYEKYFTIYDTHTGQQEEVFDSLSNNIGCINSYDCVLLSEDQFIYTNRFYSFYSSEVLTISSFKQLLNEQVMKDKKQNPLIEQLIDHQVINISVNNIKEQFYLGRKGQIAFDLLCVYTNAQSNMPLGALVEKKVIIQPSFLATVQTINTHFQGGSYCILYCFHQSSKLLLINNGVYQRSLPINLGTKDLKMMYEEQHIPKIYRNPSKVNPVIEGIVYETSGFFSSQLVQWIKTLVSPSTPCIIIGDITKNHFVMETFKKVYSKEIGGYTLPYGSLVNYNNDSYIPIDILNYLKISCNNG